MPFAEYTAGLALLASTLGGAGGAAWLVLRRRLGHLEGAATAAALGLLVTAAVIVVHLVPLSLGILSRGTVVATAVLMFAAAWCLRGPAPGRGGDGRVPAPPASPPPSSLLAGAAVTAVVLYVIAYAAQRLTEPLAGVDALSFHLPHSARWIQTGSVWQIDNFVPGWAFGNYPNNGDLLQLTAILPWHNDALIRFVTYPFLALAGVSVYAAAVELGGARAICAAFAALAVSLPTALTVAIDGGLTDPVMHATFAAGALFLIRHARTGARADLVLAGLGLGLAFGTKWYGLSCAGTALVVWAGARLLAGHRRDMLARDGLLLLAVISAAGGVWLLRNLLLSGNPFFPVKVAPLGVTIFDAPPDPIREQGGFALTHYLTDFDVWERTILPRLLDSFGLGGALLVVTAAAALLMAVRPGRRDGRVATVAAGALALAVVYTATPYSAFGPEGDPFLLGASARYGVPALLLAAMVAPWVAARLRRASPGAAGAALVLVVEAMARYDDFGGIGDFSLLEARPLARGAAGVATLAVLVMAARRIPWASLRGSRRLVPVVAAAAVVAVGLAVAGDRQQSRYNDQRYLNVDPVYSWLLRNAAEGRRVGLAGVWADSAYAPPWIAFGPRLRNEVEYVGPWIRERLERFTSEPTYRTALANGRFDLIMVALGSGPTAAAPEARWTADAGYVEVARSDRLALYSRRR